MYDALSLSKGVYQKEVKKIEKEMDYLLIVNAPAKNFDINLDDLSDDHEMETYKPTFKP